MIRFKDVVIDKAEHTIWVNDVPFYIKGTYRFQMWKHLLLTKNGYTKMELFDLLHGDDPDGGPSLATKSIDVRLCHMRPQAEKMGLRLYPDADKRQHHKHFRLVRV